MAVSEAQAIGETLDQPLDYRVGATAIGTLIIAVLDQGHRSFGGASAVVRLGDGVNSWAIGSALLSSRLA